MFKRKLTALKHHGPEKFAVNDVSQFRNLVVWLEDKKIKLYSIEARSALRDTKSDEWKQHFDKYLDDLECPVDRDNNASVMDWLLGWAVHLEYKDNAKVYNTKTSDNLTEAKQMAPQVVTSSNPLDNLSFCDDDFKDGVDRLAKLLNVTKHPDHLITLSAVCRIIKERLNADVLKHPSEHIVDGKPFPLQECDLGFETGDQILNQAAKILRLLFIHDLRDLQTQINEAIVTVQAITANPKTDTSLGQVGR